MDRRQFLWTGAALSTPLAGFLGNARGGARRFKYAICNEMFEKLDFASQCRMIRAAGFQGIEIAPFTLADHIDELSGAKRRELRETMRAEGLEFAGLHWLLITPKWLHLTTADEDVRRKSWEYFLKLIDFCADMGGGVMVLGSPKQRASQGNTSADAVRILREGLARVAPHARERGCVIAVESLPRKDTDVINTLQEAVGIVEALRTPAVQTMFDFHNTVDEREPMETLVRRYYQYIRHVHINEMDGRYPGTGNLDFLPVFRVLSEFKFGGWVSLEVFDFKPGPERILQGTMAFLRDLEVSL